MSQNISQYESEKFKDMGKTVLLKEEIKEYLDEKTQKIDNIVANVKGQIAMLKELRKTLINDVVTGKIRV